MPFNTIVITAPSGAGKSSIIQSILASDDTFTFSISHTTRYIRTNEVDGRDYYFIEEKKFKTMIENNEFLEWAKVGDFYYGSSIHEMQRAEREGKRIIFDIDVQGFEQFKKKNINALYLFIKPPSIDELKKRLLKRGTDTEEQIEKRILRAKNELEYEKKFDHVIINDDLDKSIQVVKDLLKH